MPFNQNRLFLMSLVVLVLTMSGCGQTHFVVLRNVPWSPSFCTAIGNLDHCLNQDCDIITI